ncbi:MAG: hypothetical protein OEM84_14430 [Acidimicrobiia bacterium]|nr:hypothetical protein [Acidimicrobiia bacterium]
MMGIPWVLAHQGGWDEVLYVAVPALLLLYALRRAEKRARANAEAREAEKTAVEEERRGEKL